MGIYRHPWPNTRHTAPPTNLIHIRLSKHFALRIVDRIDGPVHKSLCKVKLQMLPPSLLVEAEPRQSHDFLFWSSVTRRLELRAFKTGGTKLLVSQSEERPGELSAVSCIAFGSPVLPSDWIDDRWLELEAGSVEELSDRLCAAEPRRPL